MDEEKKEQIIEEPAKEEVKEKPAKDPDAYWRPREQFVAGQKNNDSKDGNSQDKTQSKDDNQNSAKQKNNSPIKNNPKSKLGLVLFAIVLGLFAASLFTNKC